MPNDTEYQSEYLQKQGIKPERFNLKKHLRESGHSLDNPIQPPADLLNPPVHKEGPNPRIQAAIDRAFDAAPVATKPLTVEQPAPSPEPPASAKPVSEALPPLPEPDWLKDYAYLQGEPLAGRTDRILREAEANAEAAKLDKIAQKIHREEGMRAARNLQQHINQLRNGLRREDPEVQRLTPAGPSPTELDTLLGVKPTPNEPRWNEPKWNDIPPADTKDNE